LAEYENVHTYITPFLSHLAMGTLAKLSGSIERAFVIADFLFPALIFLLFYLLAFEITQKKTLSIFSSTLFIFLPKLLLNIPPIFKYLQSYIITLALKTDTLYFSRFEDPQLTVPLYLLAFYLCLRSLKRKEKYTPIIGGVIYGLLFYSYFYYWIYFSLGLGIMLIIFLIQKQYDLAKKIGLFFSTGILVSLPHWLNTFYLMNLPHYPEIFKKFGPETGRVLNLELLPFFAYFQHAALIAALIVFFRKKRAVIVSYLAAFLLPVYLVYNLQIFTGFNVHPDHWNKPTFIIINLSFLTLGLWLYQKYFRFLKMKYLAPILAVLAIALVAKAGLSEDKFVKLFALGSIAMIALAILGLYFSQKYLHLAKQKYLFLLGWLVIILIISQGIFTQYKFIALNKDKILPAEEMASYQWLNENPPKYSVIGTPSFTTSSRIHLYTHNKTFVPNGLHTLAPNNEVWYRFFLINKIFQTDPEVFNSYLRGQSTIAGGQKGQTKNQGLYFAFEPNLDQLAVFYMFHLTHYDSSPGSAFKSEVPVAFPKEIYGQKTKEYAMFLEKPARRLHYQLDYLYFGPREQKLSENAMGQLSSFQKVYDKDNIKIYKYADK
jgi:hypothetical protein